MNPLRILSDNKATAGTLEVTSSVGNMIAGNLLNNYRGLIWRTEGINEGLSVHWDTDQEITAVVLSGHNLTPDSLVRFSMYQAYWEDPINADLLHQTDWMPGTKHPGAHTTAFWFPEGLLVGRYLKVEISDPLNPAGYLQAAHLLLGTYWSPEITADLGVQLGFQDTSSQRRAESGDLRSYTRSQHRVMNFDLTSLSHDESGQLLDLIKEIGLRKPIFLSMFPDALDPERESRYQILGKRVRNDIIASPFFNTDRLGFSLEEI